MWDGFHENGVGSFNESPGLWIAPEILAWGTGEVR